MDRSRKVPDFFKEMVTWYKTLGIFKGPKSGLEVRQQPMWHNSFVHVQGESLSFKEETGKKKQFALIDDFVDNE